MAKKIVQNTTPLTQHVGRVSIHPGAARVVDTRDLPGCAPPQPAAPPAPDPVIKMLERTVDEIRRDLEQIADPALEHLIEREREGKGRKGVLEALESERLRRAADAGEVTGGPAV